MKQFRPRAFLIIPTPPEVDIQKYTKYISFLLAVTGIFSYFITGYLSEDGFSVTALIPTFIAIPLFIMAILSEKIPNKKAVFMHVAVVFGVLCILGGVMGVTALIDGDVSPSTSEQLVLFIVGLDYTINCVMSFIHARRN